MRTPTRLEHSPYITQELVRILDVLDDVTTNREVDGPVLNRPCLTLLHLVKLVDPLIDLSLGIRVDAHDPDLWVSVPPEGIETSLATSHVEHRHPGSETLLDLCVIGVPIPGSRREEPCSHILYDPGHRA
ncbi:MAG: hypothetical protein M5U32_09230 [Myxococcota bacterium]|nr:hypothetical protein [Myxococcota bacterium]